MIKGIGTYLAAIAMLALCLYVGLGLYGALADVQEDDASFNCYVMGDMNCGPSTPWHGFVNNFKHADYR
jgi:hypothetical protein